MKELFTRSALSIFPQSLMNKLAGQFVPVFMLHRLLNNKNEPDLKIVKSIHQYLEYIRKNKYQPITLDLLYSYLESGEKLPEKAVVFTVDDGFSGQFEYMAPIFSKFDIPLTCFIITDFIDGNLWPWDDQVKYIFGQTSKTLIEVVMPNGAEVQIIIDPLFIKGARRKLVNQLKLMDQTNIYQWLQNLYNAAEIDIPKTVPERFKGGSWQQIEEFVASGHFVAPHSKTHRIISQLSDNEAFEEIQGSFYYLKSKIPSAVDILAYPSGNRCDFGSRDEQIVKASSLRGAVSAIGKTVTPCSSLTRLPRFTLPNNMCDFLQYLTYIEVVKNKFRNKYFFKKLK